MLLILILEIICTMISDTGAFTTIDIQTESESNSPASQRCDQNSTEKVISEAKNSLFLNEDRRNFEQQELNSQNTHLTESCSIDSSLLEKSSKTGQSHKTPKHKKYLAQLRSILTAADSSLPLWLLKEFFWTMLIFCILFVILSSMKSNL